MALRQCLQEGTRSWCTGGLGTPCGSAIGISCMIFRIDVNVSPPRPCRGMGTALECYIQHFLIPLRQIRVYAISSLIFRAFRDPSSALTRLGDVRVL